MARRPFSSGGEVGGRSSRRWTAVAIVAAGLASTCGASGDAGRQPPTAELTAAIAAVRVGVAPERDPGTVAAATGGPAAAGAARAGLVDVVEYAVDFQRPDARPGPRLGEIVLVHGGGLELLGATPQGTARPADKAVRVERLSDDRVRVTVVPSASGARLDSGPLALVRFARLTGAPGDVHIDLAASALQATALRPRADTLSLRRVLRALD